MNIRSKMDINHLVTKEQPAAVKHTSLDVSGCPQEPDKKHTIVDQMEQ